MADKTDLDIYGEDGELDFPKLMASMSQSSRQAETLATVRPKWSDLAASLYLLRKVANELLLTGNDEAQFSPRKLLECVDGSPAMTDHVAQKESLLNPSNELVVELLGEYVLAISDHVYGMFALLASDPPFRPLLTIGRVLLDAGAHVRYFLDPNADLRLRVSRVANVELDSIREELKDIAPGDSDQGESLIARRTQLLAAGESDGYARALGKGVPQNAFEPTLIPTGDMANLLLSPPFGHQIWRLASSVVHAQDRTILEFVSGRGDIDLSGPGLGKSMSLTYLAPCLLAVTETYKDVASYIGRSTDLLEMAIGRVHWTLEAMGGKHDAELLDAAGIDRTGWINGLAK